jgi:hypothetical protein
VTGEIVVTGLLSPGKPCDIVMSEFISDQERRRMAEFADTPLHEREPDQLLPDEGGE